MAADTPSPIEVVDDPSPIEEQSHSTSVPYDASANTSPAANGALGTQIAVSSGVAKPTTDAHGRSLNPRSCVTCRKRKVKCDKLHPCSNCSKAHIECIFPSPGRAPRKIRKAGEGKDNKELLERLRRLEGVVVRLGAEVPGDKSSEAELSKDAPTDEAVKVRSNSTDAPIDATTQVAPELKTSDVDAEREFQIKSKWVEEMQQGRFENRFGRLVVNEGKSRYVNNSFWANLSNEVEDLKGILNQSSDEDDEPTPPPVTTQPSMSSNHHGFIFGHSSQSVDLLSLHPLGGQIELYWNIFKDRVDPIVKILHIPTLQPTVLRAAAHLANLSRGFECLLFAMYYCVTTSLPARDCLLQLGEEKSVLLTRYRFAVEQALARANFLTTEEMVVLQAFVLFLICLRRNNDARVIWTLTGLVVRIAQTIGIHRDGSHFNLSPFEIEMRRRLWWQVCILDTRASEDHGCDPTILEQSFDTKMPMNINDVDISPEMTEFPADRQGCTDMSFNLLRFEVANYFRRINYIPPGPPRGCHEYLSTVTLEDKERWIAECHKKLEERYLKHCDMSVPLYWVTATVARLMLSKMWLMVYHPFQRQDGGMTLSSETKEKLFITSLENMEYSLLLETEARTMKWGWLFRTYVQWHALAFTLSELCHRTTGDMVERAWVAVEKTRDGRWGINITDNKNAGHLWRPLRKIYRRAREARQRGLQEERMMQQRVANPPARTYSPNANPMFGHPSRPRMTRAPLSQAQLQRFTEGPSFGQAPLDKHELLRSPKLSETKPDIPVESSNLTPEASQPTAPAMLVNGFNNPNVSAAYPSTMNGGAVCAAPIAYQRNGRPGFGQNFLAGMSTMDFSTEDPAELSKSFAPQNLPLNDINDDMIPMDSLDSLDTSLDNDLSVMDTSGDVNWESWDQLVRQFNMDGDSTGNSTNGMNWNTANWEPGSNVPNLRMGMGMGSGDWF